MSGASTPGPPTSRPRCRGYGAYISCDGADLIAYGTYINEQSRTATCYIQSEAGKEFTVHCEDYTNDTGASLSVYMDGRFMERQGSVIPRFRGRIRGVQTSAVSVRPFRFSDVPLASDNEDAINGTVNYDTLGLIELQIHRVQLMGCDPDTLVTRTAPEVSPIPLRQIPPMDLHCVSLGAAIPSQLSHSLACLWDQLDQPDRPYVTFRFYYRPRQTLQTQGIIPFDDYLSTSSNKSFSPTPTRNTSTTKHQLEAPDNISIAGRRKRLKLEEPPSFSTATPSRMAVDNAIQAPSVPSIAVLQEPEEDSSEISIRIRTLENTIRNAQAEIDQLREIQRISRSHAHDRAGSAPTGSLSSPLSVISHTSRKSL